MTEHQFDTGFDPDFDSGFDWAERLDDLRCHTSEWLEVRRGWLVREQRRLRVEELAVLAVLDERGRVHDAVAAKDGITTRTARRMRQTARKLKAQPNVAHAAAQGMFSEEQLDRIADLAEEDPEAEARWAREGAGWSPEDLAAEVRRSKTPTVEDATARRAARLLRYWWDQDAGMLEGRFSLPDIDGTLVEQVLEEMIERMRPATGQPWDSREHRGADALVELRRPLEPRHHLHPASRPARPPRPGAAARQPEPPRRAVARRPRRPPEAGPARRHPVESRTRHRLIRREHGARGRARLPPRALRRG